MNKQALFCLFLFLLLFFIPIIFFDIDFSSKNSDWKQHWLYSKDSDSNNYPPFSSLLLSPFNSSFSLFFLASVFLIAGLIGLLLWFLFKNWIYIAFFFMISNSFWVLTVGGHVSQLMISVLLLGLFYFGKWWQWLLILGLSYFIHTSGFKMIAFTVLVLFAFKLFEKKNQVIVGLCGGGGLIKDYTLLYPIFGSKAFPKTSILEFANFFSKICPLPVFFAGLKGLWNENKPMLSAGLLLFFGNVFFIGSVRVFESLALFFLIGFFYWHSKTRAEWKVLFIPLALFIFAINYYTYLQYLLIWKWC